MALHHRKLLPAGERLPAGRVPSPAQGSSCLGAWVCCSLRGRRPWAPLAVCCGENIGEGGLSTLMSSARPSLPDSSAWPGRALQGALAVRGPACPPAPAQNSPFCCTAAFGEGKTPFSPTQREGKLHFAREKPCQHTPLHWTAHPTAGQKSPEIPFMHNVEDSCS